MPRRNNINRRRGLRSNGGVGGTRQRIVRASGTGLFGRAGGTALTAQLPFQSGAIVDTVMSGFIGASTGIDGTYVPICPGTLTPRSANIGDNFSEYKVRMLRFKYVPNMKGVDTVTTTTYNNISGVAYSAPVWEAAVGWVDDPNYTGPQFSSDEVVDYGGRKVDMSRPWSFVVRPKTGWKYQPTPVNNFSIAGSAGDLRSMFSGNFLLVWDNVGSTVFPFVRTGSATSELYVVSGTITVDWVIDFRYPADPDLTKPSPPLAAPVVAAQLLQRPRPVKSTRSKEQEEKEQFLVVGRSK